MRFRGFPILLAPLFLAACDVPEDVRIQELPALSQTSIEARLGLPEVRGPWRFAGWELQEGDTLGLEAELPTLGVLMLQEQKRDSLAGFYATEGGRAPVQGEVRRDSVLSLVAFLQAGDGRYLVGSVSGDTLRVEATSLIPPEAWRGDARAVFVRSQTALTPFVRVRGMAMPAPAVDSAAPARLDSLAVDSAGGTAGTLPPTGTVPAPRPGMPPAETPPGLAQPGAVTQPLPRTQQPQPDPVDAEEEEVEEEAEPVPPPQPAVERRDPPRVLGVPVQRDTGGGGDLP